MTSYPRNFGGTRFSKPSFWGPPAISFFRGKFQRIVSRGQAPFPDLDRNIRVGRRSGTTKNVKKKTSDLQPPDCWHLLTDGTCISNDVTYIYIYIQYIHKYTHVFCCLYTYNLVCSAYTLSVQRQFCWFANHHVSSKGLSESQRNHHSPPFVLTVADFQGIYTYRICRLYVYSK